MTDITVEKPKTPHDWINISCERYRVYTFLSDSGCAVTLKILSPYWLAVTDSGHRILDVDGRGHYIKNCWVAIDWEPRANAPAFVA